MICYGLYLVQFVSLQPFLSFFHKILFDEASNSLRMEACVWAEEREEDRRESEKAEWAFSPFVLCKAE